MGLLDAERLIAHAEEEGGGGVDRLIDLNYGR